MSGLSNGLAKPPLRFCLELSAQHLLDPRSSRAENWEEDVLQGAGLFLLHADSQCSASAMVWLHGKDMGGMWLSGHGGGLDWMIFTIFSKCSDSVKHWGRHWEQCGMGHPLAALILSKL